MVGRGRPRALAPVRSVHDHRRMDEEGQQPEASQQLPQPPPQDPGQQPPPGLGGAQSARPVTPHEGNTNAGWFVLAFRLNEIRDPSQDAPVLDPEKLSAMARLEDAIAQNHMISLVHIKPGIVRAIVARVTLLALGLLVRAKWGPKAGYLQSMRTIHFAHWALVSNGARLMFHSNFDGSWESYLDDFIEKAHAGLTAAWTHGVGFPPTRWLTKDGASSGG